MRKLFIISFLLTVGSYGFGQETILRQIVDALPLFNGTNEETHYDKTKSHFDSCNLKLLSDGKNMHLAVSFIIDAKGVPTNPVLLFGKDSTMFNIIIDCMKKGPNWIPAKKNGIDVPCQYNLTFSN